MSWWLGRMRLTRDVVTAARVSAGVSALTMAALFIALAFEIAVRSAPLPEPGRFLSQSVAVADRDGQLLWAFLSPDERWRWITTPADLTDDHRAMLIAYEDRRFHAHNGVDLLALSRAAYQTVRHGRIVSGGSTITMQTVRLLAPKPRTLSAKVEEIFAALRLERHLSKDDILTIYLTTTGFGGNIEGVRAAALGYFDKYPWQLTKEEAALLVALPQSPETRRPDRFPGAARRARDRVLARVGERAPARPPSVANAPFRPPRFTRAAPHLAAKAAAIAAAPLVATRLDGQLQRKVARVARRAAQAWPAPVSVAVVVLENRDGSVAAYVGGSQFADPERAGHVDLAAAPRSPGSAMKPFIYGMAFERLIVHPDTVFSDEPVRFGGYQPENFDGAYAGDLTIRSALARSINTAAVALLDAVGTDTFLARLRAVGVPLATPKGDSEAGLAVALGGGGISLFDLTRLYAAMAGDGRVFSPRLLATDRPSVEGRLMPANVARGLADILADVGAPPGFAQMRSRDGGRRVAYKTGTSYGFRDAWAVGFDQTYTVGVWIGRPDGRPHLGSYGATTAAPVMMRVFSALPRPVGDVASRRTALGPLESPRQLPPRLRRFVSRGQIDVSGPVQIAYPPDKSVLGSPGDAADTVALEARGGRPPYRWFIDGEPLAATDAGAARWHPDGIGQFDVRVMDAAGGTARVSIWLDG